jgi:hypothetical protein
MCRQGTFLLVLAALAAGCGSTADETQPAPPAPSAPVTPSISLTASASLLTGHTGLAGFTLSGDGSTLYVSTETYHGGPTRLVLHALDLRAPDARPVRVQEGDDGPYLSWRAASDDGAFVLTSRGDGLHRVSRDGSADVLVPESERSWFSPAISADGGTVAFVRDDELRVFDVAAARLERVALPHDQSASPYAVLDARTVLVGGSGADGSWLRRVSIGGASEDVCTGCRLGNVARTARLVESDDGSRRLVGGDGERAIGSGSPVALAISGRVVARVEMREARPYEYERHLLVEGAAAPIDRVIGDSLTSFGVLLVGDDGTVVAEAAIRGTDPRTPERSIVSCLVVLHPSARVVACEPCDSTAEHCR